MSTLTALPADRRHVRPDPPGVRTRVLHVVASLEPGGMERGLVRLLTALTADSPGAQTEHGVAILGSADKHLLFTCRQHADVWQLGLRRRPWHAPLWLRKVVRSFEPNVIHARATGSWFDAAFAARALPDTRLVLGFHGREHLAPPSWRRRMLLKWTLGRADAIVTLSRESALWIQKIWAPPFNRINVVPNGVDIERFRPAAPADRQLARHARLGPGDRFLIMCVANLMPIKALDVLLQAWRRVTMVVPDARLVITGDGPERDALQQLLVTLRLRESVELAIGNEDVRDWLQLADLFVLPSRYECCSNALLEAMATGLPCIATAVGGNPELIQPNHTGWLVPPDNAPALARTVIGALLNSAARERLGQRAREHVAIHHRLEQTAMRYQDLYSRLATPARRDCDVGKELCPCAG